MFRYCASEPKGTKRKPKPVEGAERFMEYEETKCKWSFLPQRKVNLPWFRVEQMMKKN